MCINASISLAHDDTTDQLIKWHTCMKDSMQSFTVVSAFVAVQNCAEEAVPQATWHQRGLPKFVYRQAFSALLFGQKSNHWMVLVKRSITIDDEGFVPPARDGFQSELIQHTWLK